jgi:membrane-associated phospholipid phosphatase
VRDLTLIPLWQSNWIWVALRANLALVSTLFFLALIALSLLLPAGDRLDTWGFQLLNRFGNRPTGLDRAFWLATQVGNMVTAFVVAGALFLLGYRGMAIIVIFGTLTLWVVVETLKALTRRSRPYLVIEGTRVIGTRERGRSFPSGHTAQTFFLATLLSHEFALGVCATVALYAVAVVVGFTRMYLGVHYPRDVIGGAVLGYAWAILLALLYANWIIERFSL